MKKSYLIGLFCIANIMASEPNASDIVAAQEDLAFYAKDQFSKIQQNVGIIAQQAKKIATDVQKEFKDKIDQLQEKLKDLQVEEKTMQTLRKVSKYAKSQYEKLAKQVTKAKEDLYKQLIRQYKKTTSTRTTRSKKTKK